MACGSLVMPNPILRQIKHVQTCMYLLLEVYNIIFVVNTVYVC